jgi:predicted AlkP superfamily phosphohydrolase/phosphomutase
MENSAGRLSLLSFLAVIIAAMMITGCAAKEGRKVIVIGLDGFSYDLAAPLIEEGSLPTLARIMKEGAFGELESSIPPMAPTAWTTAVTGTNPGKHGIFCYSKGFTFENETFVNHYYSAVDRNVSAVWNLLSEANKTSIVIGVPFTSPPDTLKGMMVAGGPHPNRESFTYPGELASSFPSEYTLAYSGTGRKGQEYLNYLKSTHEKEKTAALGLMDSEQWDFFMAVFTFPERVQRYYWQFMDVHHPLHTEEGGALFGRTIPDVYRDMDRLVGEFESRASALGADLIIVSSYGFGPVYTTLNGENLIHANWPPEGRDIFVVNWDKYGGIFGITFTKPPEVTKENWEKYSNLATELHGVLTSLRDPRTGEAVIDTLYHRANIYSGPSTVSAPDVIAIEKNGYVFLNWTKTAGGEIFSEPTEAMPGALPRGKGILFAKGPDIAAGKRLEGGRVMDLAPTILYLGGTTIPKYMDGRVLEGMISREYLGANPVKEKIVDTPLSTKRKPRELTEEEENTLREQMKGVEAGL